MSLSSNILPALSALVVVAVSYPLWSQPAKNPSLTPPGAPADQVFRTMDQVEPRIPVDHVNTPGDATATYVISKPGSYYLTGNILGESGKDGIDIRSANVSLDLSGFEIQGVPNSESGIVCSSIGGYTIKNGYVTKWGVDGVVASNTQSEMVITEVHASRNTQSGFNLTEGVVSHCVASYNGSHGFVTSRTNLTSCTAEHNSSSGFIVSQGTLTDSLSTRNDSRGFELSQTIATNCYAGWNSHDGFRVEDARVSNCKSVGNGLSGFEVIGGSSVFNCTASSNAHGSTVEAGILVDDTYHPTVTDSSEIRGNLCFSNGTGILVSNTGNFVRGNTCYSNYLNPTTLRNFNIVSGNIVGEIVKLNPASSAITGAGNSGGGTGTTDPFANFAD